MRSTNSHLTIGSIASSFIQQLLVTTSRTLKDATRRDGATELSEHLRYDIGDLDIRSQAERRQEARDLSLLRSI